VAAGVRPDGQHVRVQVRFSAVETRERVAEADGTSVLVLGDQEQAAGVHGRYQLDG